MLSIINEHPSSINGSDLLHKLVAPSSATIAIDFLQDGSTRRKLSYKTLHASSNALAQKITKSLDTLENASPIIPVLLPQSPELYVLLLAILKAGKAFCPLNLDTPAERLDFILGDISARLLITDSATAKALKIPEKINTLYIDECLLWNTEGTCMVEPHVCPDDLAYVLYTSGSTGLPKAVSVSHRAVTQSLLAHDRHIPHFSRFLQFAAPTFDVSIFEIFFPLYRGQTVTSRTRMNMLNNLAETIHLLDVDAAELTPTVVSNLLDGRSSVPGLNLLLTIGEMLTQDVIQEFGGTRERNGILWAMYGPTEAAIHCTLQPHMMSDASTQTIGFPLDTVSAFIVSPLHEGEKSSNFAILPMGEEGELAIGGPQIAEGYLNRRDITARSFMHHPKYGYVYRTGDRARICNDGTIRCLGRVISGQVKLRGQRVELGEIEKTISKVDGCRSATAMVVEESLIVFCATGDRQISRTDVLHTCKQWLPQVMIPNDVIFVRHMPQLPSGKIDQKALLALYHSEHIRKETGKTDLSKSNTANLLDLLQVHFKQRLTPYTILASVGLDSLRAIKLSSILRNEGFQLQTLQLLSATTVGDLTDAITHARRSSSVDQDTCSVSNENIPQDLPELRPWLPEIASILPCAPLQQAMLAETIARSSAYCNWIEVELSQPHSFEQIQAACQCLGQANEILRSGFWQTAAVEDTFVQVVWKNLNDAQIQHVPQFSRTYWLDRRDPLLRPLSIQVMTKAKKPRLLLQIHHAIYDGWSLDLLLQDLGEILDGSQAKHRRQYRNVIAYHNGHKSQSHADEEYWAKVLHGCPEVMLPNYNGRFVGCKEYYSLTGRSIVNTQALQDQSRSYLINAQVYFQAAVAYVQSLYLGLDDVVIGNVTSGRTIPVTGIEDIIGPCIAALPFRLSFNQLDRVCDILHETHRMNRKSLEHCSLPLRQIVKASKARAGVRLFDVLFVWQESLHTNPTSPTSASVVDSADEPEFKITLEYQPHPDHIAYRATFDRSAISQQQINYLLRQIDSVVQLFLEDVNCATSEIAKCFLNDDRSVSNPTPQLRPPQYGPSHAVERWASTTPEKKALVVSYRDGDRLQNETSLTYATLNDRANQVAHLMMEHGICPGSLVGVVMEKSANLYITILAVLKIGAGYLPLVPDLPQERSTLIFGEAQVAACVVDSSSVNAIEDRTSAMIINLDDADISNYPESDIEIAYDGTRIAYAVYTSGSTGTPKGVLVTQDNLMTNLDYLATVYPYKSESILLQSCSQAFDVSVFEIFFAWHVGICLSTARKDDLFFDLEDAINQLNITHLSLTPTVAALIDPDNVPKVEFLVTAGEAVAEHVWRKWAGRGLHQGYGPSETTNICTVCPSVSTSDLINNIGKPFANTSAFVLDPKSETILPRGAVGELCFGGYQVFRGYLGRPDLTAAKMIDHPTFGRIYRSGDLGLMLADDSILFTGRLDDQVKIRGQRVELGEISSIVLDQDCVRDCTTVLRRDSRNVESLVTFWVPSDSVDKSFKMLIDGDFDVDIATIFMSLSHRLPAYMVPTNLVPISRLPMTVQGKIDKRTLLRNFDDLSPVQKAITAASYDAFDDGARPSRPWELDVAKILSETLGLSEGDIRLSSSFFSLGLDSVSAIRLSNRLRDEGLGQFSISTILKNPTLALLSRFRDAPKTFSPVLNGNSPTLEKFINAQETSRIRTIFADTKVAISTIFPCTPLQEAMLADDQSTEGSSYSNVMVFSVNGDLSRLQQCWRLMTQRHEILRTVFVVANDPSYAFAQVVLKEWSVPCDEIGWSSDAFKHANKMLAKLRRANRPPVWLGIARSDVSTRLLFACHHAVYDGIAMQILLKEVQEAYYKHELPPPISYDTFLQQMLSQDLRNADQFWAARLQRFEPTAFPDLTGRVQKGPTRANSWRGQLRIPLSKVREVCRDMSVTLLSVIHANWAKLLHLYTGESDICFGSVVSGRALPGQALDRLVAPCFNTLPVRVNYDFGNSNVALVQNLHAANVETIAYQLTPLRRIQNAVVSDGGRLFDTLVILQQPSEPLDKDIWELQEDCGVMDIPLVCEVSQNEIEDCLQLTLHYHSTIMSEYEAPIIAATFEASLATIMNQPHAPAHDTTGFPDHLQTTSNPGPDVPDSKAQLLHSGFEHNAICNPDRVALDFLHADGKKTTWSYEVLNQKANSIAHKLIQLGVMREDIVPVHIPKSPLFYASILGIMKAGAAFAPVHPRLPQARKDLMIKDLGARFILHTKGFMPTTNVHGLSLIDAGDIRQVNQVNPFVDNLTSSCLAYCIFTSGSTGAPKAVSMEHRAPIQTIECSKSLVPWSIASRLLQYAATTFDMCYYDCFLAWTLGFTLCAAEQEMMLNDLSMVIKTLDTDLLDLTPSVAASISRSQVPNAKWLFCIGEALTPGIVKEWAGACVNSYGPSEAAFCTTIYPVSHENKPSVIGSPFSSTRFAIFPSNGDRPLPLLSVGELHIGGLQLARGYHGKPDLTADKFVEKGGERFYRSGDIVRILGNGTFEFIGRTDDQVKIRGLRVELGEINSVLCQAHPDIDAVVTQILKKNTDAKEQLVAFLKRKKAINHEQDALRKLLRQASKDRLPSYMVPQFFIFVEHFPRSTAGKLDKNALTKIFRRSVDTNLESNGRLVHSSKHQWTSLEARIRGVFAHLSSSSLGDVLPTTTIYQLGMDSISAVQVAAALRSQGYHVNASDVMRFPTCVELAVHIEHEPGSEQATSVQFDFNSFDESHRSDVLASCSLADADVVAIRPCTPLQTGMLSQMLAKEGGMYINYIRLELEIQVSLEKLQEAWRKAMHTHPMLRTGFVHLEDKACSFGMIEYAVQAAKLPWDMQLERKASTFDSWLETVQGDIANKPHQLPWRIRAVCEHQTYFLDLALFHGTFDAQSLQSILQDVILFYFDEHVGPPDNINAVVDGILHRSTDFGHESQEFWSQVGKNIAPSRFPNLAPLRYKPQLPVVQKLHSKRSLTELEDACKRSNTTLQAAGIASWLTLISAYTGEPTASCGVVLSGRTFEAAESAVFPCINTVPVVQKVSTEPEEMLAAITSLTAELQQHQHIPLNKIQKLMGASNESLFDTIFAYQKIPIHEDSRLIWRLVDEKATTEYPLSIELEPQGGQLKYCLTFLPNMIPRDQAALMLAQLDHLLDGFLFPKQTVTEFGSSIYSVTPAQEPTLSSEAQLLHEFVELTSGQFPDRIAFEFFNTIHESVHDSKCWTYSQLDAEGNQVANLLISYGVQPGDLVGVCFDKCAEASFAMLGILKAGAAFVAIDPGAPAARQSFIIKDSGATAVLSMSAQSARFVEDVHVPVLDIDTIKTCSFSSVKPALAREIRPDDRSYCLYTSGTTGTPKGCELTHENAVQALLAFQRLFAGHWNSKSRWLQFASFHFDVSVLEQYWSWSVGICVVSAPRDVIFEDLAESINTLGITHIDLTPSLAQILHPHDVPSLCRGVFITGGESLKQEILDVWGPKGVIYNGYGPTEATIGCTMYARVPANGKPSNIGRQFDNVGTFVLQPGSDIPVLRGGIGELCVSGKLVGKGYLNRKDLTEKSFPYLQGFQERVYRTGDLVRILHDDTFEFLGRADDQVKLRGQRLEIGEINTVIRKSDANISDVATLILKHPQQQTEQLVAFVVYGQTTKQPNMPLGNASDTRKLRDACHDKLPPYMVPTHFVALQSIPLNVNNKADGKELKELYESFSAAELHKLSIGSSENDQFWSHEEIKLRDVFRNQLDVNEEAISKGTSFFELGMDSISVIGVVRALKVAGIQNATASLVMKHSTVRRLAKALSSELQLTGDRASLIAAQQAIAATQHRHRRAIAKTLSLSVTDIEDLAPCTPLQQGMIARSLESENGLYFNTFMFKLSRTIDQEKLEHAWQKVHASTQILRTQFARTEDGYVQVVLRNIVCPWRPAQLEKNELMDKCLSRIHGDWIRSNSGDFRHPFELRHLHSHGILVVHIFHGLYDGISIELIFQAVWDAYNGNVMSGVASTFLSALPHGPLRVMDGAKEFWHEHLSSAVQMPSQKFIKGSSQPIKISRRIRDLATLESTRRMLNVTAQAIAQACWLHVMQEHARTTTTMGIVVSGRSMDLEDAHRVIGPMFNTIPYHHQYQQSESWASIIKRVHDFNVAAHPYQHTPLRDIIKWCKMDRTRPLFDSLFVFQVSQDDMAWLKNDSWEVMDGKTVADYPLALEVEQRADATWDLTLVAQGRIFDQSTSITLLDKFGEALRQAITDPSATVMTSSGTNGTIHSPSEEGNGRKDIPNRNSGYTWTTETNAIRVSLAEAAGTEVSAIDETTSIFELGLDSIDAIKLSSRLKNQGVSLPVSGIMRGLTIANMAKHIKKPTDLGQDENGTNQDFTHRKQELRGYLERQGLDMTQIEDVLPITPLQESMVVEMTFSGHTRYYNFDVMELDQDTDVDRLRIAWTQVVETTPILRTAFVKVDDNGAHDLYAQVIRPKPHRFWEQRTLDTKPDFPALCEEIRREFVQLDPSTPPFNIMLIYSPDRLYLVLGIAHALYDGWSLGLLHADVKSAYQGQLEERPDYQETLSDILRLPESDASDFWGDYLDKVGPSVFPRQSHSSEGLLDAVHRLEQQSTVAALDLVEFAKKCNVSLQTLGQAVFAIVLGSYLRSLDVVFGSVLSGRDDEITSKVVFPIMNTTVVRTILHGTRMELLRHIQEDASTLKEWQHYPLREVLRRACTHGGLFESLFIYQKGMEGVVDEKPLYTSIAGQSDLEYPVCVEMELVRGQLTWRCAVKEEVFDAAGGDELLSRLDHVLRDIMNQPYHPVIDSTSQGISLCGLYPFDSSEYREVRNISDEDSADEQSQPRAETVTTIRETLATIADLPDENVTDDMTMFHMGLDSISAIKASSVLRQKGVMLSVGDMLRAGTIVNMARTADARSPARPEQKADDTSIIEAALRGLDHVAIIRCANAEGCLIDNVKDVDMLPATAGQVYMLSMGLNTNGRSFYPEFKYSLEGDISFKRLQEAWKALVTANPILRTYLVATEDVRIPYVQLVRKDMDDDLHHIELKEHTDKRMTAKQPWAHLSAAPISTGWNLRLKIHHILYDGVSLPLLMQQFQSLCNNNAPTPWPSIFPTFIARTRQSKRSEAFWKWYLQGSLQHGLPQPSASTSTRCEIFSPQLFSTKGLEKTARDHGISLQSLFLATYARIYANLTNPSAQTRHEVILGIYLANRALAIQGIQHAAVPTLNILPLRVRTQDMIQSAKQIQEDLQKISDAQHVGASLWEIDTWTGVKVDSTVNFLTLPGEECAQAGNGEVKIVPARAWDEDMSKVTKYDPGWDGEVPENLRCTRVNVAYLHAIDMEATVRNGALDVGIFAPAEMLSLDDGNQLLVELKTALSRL
ncbi:hypothetical protein ACEQ8H_007039 [Pleosporales sp. CAS-2024a]